MPFLLCLIVLWCQSSWASKLYAQSSTHAYWICQDQSCVFITNRADGKLEKKESIVDPRALQVYQGKVYILSKQSDPFFIILDQKTHAVERAVFIGCCTQDFAIYEGKAYLLHREFQDIEVFDLQKETLVNRIKMVDPKSICIDKDKAYIANPKSRTLSIVDLSDPLHPVSKVDLGTEANDVHIARGKAWTVSKGYRDIAEINLTTLRIDRRMKAERIFGDSLILGKDLYLSSEGKKEVYIIDLVSGSMVTDNWSFYSDSYVSDTAIYVRSGAFKHYQILRYVRNPVFVLFDPIYPGITGSLWGDGLKEFNEMCEALQLHDFKTAREKFHEALGYCHPKAYALAAFAFMKGKLGAEKNIHLGFEFWQSCDRDLYYSMETFFIHYLGEAL